MSKHSYSRHKGEKKGISVGGCIGAIVLSMLWFCVVCFLMFDVIPKEKQVGMFYDISLLVLLLLPLYIDIKLLCRLIAKIVRLFVARRKSKSLSNHSADLHSTPPDDVGNTTMPPVSQDPTPPTPQNPTPSIPQIPLAPERRITQAEIRTTAPPALVVCRKHWTAYFAPALISAFLLFIGLMLLFVNSVSGLIMIAIAVVVFGIPFLRIHSYRLILREDAVVGKRGIIKTVKMVSPISSVQDIAVHRGFWGKIFGYSSIAVSTAGVCGIEYVFYKVTNADRFQRKYIELTAKNATAT